jgi:LytS/YehU family sensor histidine kinase
MEGEWSYAHDLVNMYLGIAYLADHKLDPEEERTFLVKFKEWMPHMSVDQFVEIWSEVKELYDTLGSDENRYALYLQSTLNVARLLEDSSDQLKCIIQDLVDIAAADGVLNDREATMIKASAIAYGLNIELSVDEDAKRIRLTFGD